MSLDTWRFLLINERFQVSGFRFQEKAAINLHFTTGMKLHLEGTVRRGGQNNRLSKAGFTLLGLFVKQTEYLFFTIAFLVLPFRSDRPLLRPTALTPDT